MAVASPTRHRCPELALVAILGLAILPAEAAQVVIANGGAQIYLRIGRTGGATSTVSFAVPASVAGTGTPVLGTALANAGSAELPNFPAACPANHVRIVATARAPASNTRTATLRVNSSGVLASGPNSIPFTDFDWISTDPEIPSGPFSGSATQFLYSFMNSRSVSVCHQFRFLNTNVYPPGTYTGTLVYNLNMP